MYLLKKEYIFFATLLHFNINIFYTRDLNSFAKSQFNFFFLIFSEKNGKSLIKRKIRFQNSILKKLSFYYDELLLLKMKQLTNTGVKKFT